MNLTPRQAQIALLVAGGYSSKQIAAQTGLRPATVRVHALQIARKIGGAGRPCIVITRYVMQGRMELPVPIVA